MLAGFILCAFAFILSSIWILASSHQERARERSILELFGFISFYQINFLDHRIFDSLNLNELPIERLNLSEMRLVLREYCNLQDFERAIQMLIRRNPMFNLCQFNPDHSFYHQEVIPLAFACDSISIRECLEYYMESGRNFCFSDFFPWIQAKIGCPEKINEFLSHFLCGENSIDCQLISGIRIPT
jgi:hypothetical protein